MASDVGPCTAVRHSVVKYVSAHRTDVDSEIVVRSPHSCQPNPATVAEVRRILLLHLTAP